MAKIMVVDDERGIRKVVEAILGGEGYEVVTASNGEECLAKLKEEKPDLILIDFFMPEMSGRELCEKIRKDSELSSLKLAFFTVAEFSDAGMSELKKLNVLDYIKKPFDNADLIRRVKKLLGE